MDKIKEILLSKQAKRLYWNTFNGFLGLFIVYLTDINWAFAPVAIAICNGITKEINKRFL